MDRIQHLRFLIKISEREGINQLSILLAPLELTPSQCEVLQILHENEPLSLKEIGSLIICEKNFPSRLVQKLVDKQLIFKSISIEDNRKSIFHLTKSGRKIIPLIKEKEQIFNQQVENAFNNSGHIDEMIKILSHYLEGSEGLQKLNKRIEIDNNK